MQGSIGTQNAISPGHLIVQPNAELFPQDVGPGFITQPGAAAAQLNVINAVAFAVKVLSGNGLPYSHNPESGVNGFGHLTGIQDHGTNY